jgi:glutamate decarboxylase/sulfinoalanine decarboxylase
MAMLLQGIFNTNVHAYSVSPVFTVMELECVRILAEIFGMDPEKVDGVSNPGGTMSNMMALIVARH